MAGVRRYELLEKIGAGGMAEVYLADAHVPGGPACRVVVKKIHPHYSEDPAYRRMFMDEARIAASLDHPNIVRVVDLGRMDDQLFIALEHVEGKDLQQVLRGLRAAGRKVPFDAALHTTAEILRALDHAHTRTAPSGKPLQIVHRDVTPANVLVASDGSVKITDFGVAKAAVRAGQTIAGVIKGNVRYMAPEQVGSRPLDARTDLYAAGMILHTLLSGKHPFEDDPLVKAIERCVDGDVPRPSEMNPDVPAALDAVVMRAVAKDRLQRFPSAASFLLEIGKIAAQSRALETGRSALGALVRGLSAPPGPDPRAPLSIVSRLGPLIAEAAREGNEVVFRTTGKMVNPDLLPPEAEAAAARRSRRPFQLAGHADAVSAVAAFPDAKRLLSASHDQTLRVWNVGLVREQVVMRGHAAAVTCCALSGDGALALSGGRDNRVRLWDAARGDLLATLPGHEGWVFSVAFAADGRHVVSGGFDRVVRVWDLTTKRPVHELAGHRDTVAAVGISPDAKWALSASYDGTVRVWDLRGGDLRRTFEGESETESLRSMAGASDGSLVLTGGTDGVARLWDFHSGIELRSLTGHREPITGVALSRNLKLAATASLDATVRLWAVEPGLQIRSFECPAPAAALALAPDLRWVAAGASDRSVTIFPL